MKYIKGIKEGFQMDENINILNEIIDSFYFLDDDWGIDFNCFFMEKKNYSQLGYSVTKKYDKLGNLILSSTQDLPRINNQIDDEYWILRAGGKIEVNIKILDLIGQINGSIRMCERMLGLDGLGSRSSISFRKTGGNIWKSFFLNDLINVSNREKYSEIKEYIEKCESQKLIPTQKVDISIQFRK